MAQQRGVANVRMRPTKATWRGALALGYRLNRPLESNLFMIMGIRTIPEKSACEIWILKNVTSVLEQMSRINQQHSNIGYNKIQHQTAHKEEQHFDKYISA